MVVLLNVKVNWKQRGRGREREGEGGRDRDRQIGVQTDGYMDGEMKRWEDCLT